MLTHVSGLTFFKNIFFEKKFFRKAWLHAETEVDVIGSEVNLSYTYNYYGNHPDTINQAARGEGDLGAALKGAKRPMVIMGAGVFDRPDGEQLHAAVRSLCDVRF